MSSVPLGTLARDTPAGGSPAPVDDREVLLALAEATSSTLDLRQVLQATTDAGTQLSGAEFGAFFYNGTDDDGELYRFAVLSGAEAEHFRAMPEPRITALFEPTFSGHGTVRLDDVSLDARHTGLPAGHLPVRSYLATPCVSRTGEVLGALLFGHREPGRFGPEIERAVRHAASQAAVAIEHVRLFDAAQRARQLAEQAAGRLAVLQQLTAGLADSVTESDVLDVLLAGVVGPLGAASVRVYAGDTTDWRQVGWRTAPGTTPLPPPAGVLPPPIARAMVDGAPVARPTSTDTRDFPTLVRGGDCTILASLCLPITTRAGVHGAIGLLWVTPREFDADELTMLVAAGGQIGAALERARLYEAERSARRQLTASMAAVTATARTLQRSLLPRELPPLAEVSVAVRYLPGSRDIEIGGDWYDVVATDTGAIFVIGDVQGHSLAAAALMGQLRTGLHAYLAEGHELDVAVGRANTLLGELDPEVMATCCVAELDFATGRLRVVRAGHPHPVVRRANGATEALDTAVGVPLGVLSRTTWPVTTVALDVGDRLVLYTDGLVERRGADIEAGLVELIRAVGESPFGDGERAADDVIARVGRDSTDDVALLVCDVVGARVARETAGLRLVRGPSAVAEARAFTRETLVRWRCDVEDDATLLVSELVTNAIRHTDGNALLQLRREPGRVRLSVSDSETRPPSPDMRFRPQATSGRGMALVEALSSAWGVLPTGAGKTVWAELPTDD